jgi:hypothetical protein
VADCFTYHPSSAIARLGIDSSRKKESSGDIRVPAIDPGADAWRNEGDFIIELCHFFLRYLKTVIVAIQV